MESKVSSNNSEQDDHDLTQMEKQLLELISTAKQLANTCKTTDNYNDLFTKELIFPEYKPSVNYNEQFWKTYFKNQRSFTSVKQLSDNISNLQKFVRNIESKQEDLFKAFKIKNRKKNRRLANEIEKKFTCPYQKCYKVYGSDVSMNLHIKLKHNGGNKTDRLKLAEAICLAELNNSTPPKITLQLPPGYLEDYKKNQFQVVVENGSLSELKIHQN